MLTKQFLYESYEQVCKKLSYFDSKKSILLQIFTNALTADKALELAQGIQALYPNAQIIGSSVSGVIFEGEQYDNRTLIVAEQYAMTALDTHFIRIEGKNYTDICDEMNSFIGEETPSLLRLFVGAYYDYSHQMIETMNVLRPDLKIVGGISGEIQPDPHVTPFVFDGTQAVAQALVCCTLRNSEMSVYGRINTSHETIGGVHTITETRDRSILQIENEPAKDWLERNFGILGTKEYSSWEEIAQNDPLVRLQLALDDHKRAIRFIHYDESNDQISQYFSRFANGTKFRISYTSPSKCAEESMETCREVATTSIEHLFCYSCLFRKLYLKNCAKWELTPYHKNPVNGVFLLGEFGYSEDGNALLNGSCVLSGVAEKENYLSVDMSSLEAIEDIRNEDEKLMEFIVRKQSELSTAENKKILEEMIAHESNHLTNPFQRMSVGVFVGDLSKFEADRESLQFNKLCMVRAENADVIIGQSGQLGYFSHLRIILESLGQSMNEKEEVMGNLHFYSIKTDTFLVASNQTVDHLTFSSYVRHLQKRCDEVQKAQTSMPFLLRFVLVRNHPFLLERAYAIMENCRNSQLHIIADEHFQDGELNPLHDNVADELKCIQLIQYALEHNQVVPYYQGLYNNKTKKIDKYEALMRLCDGEGKVYTPYHFMDTAKKYRMYLDLNLKMFQSVLRDFDHLDCSVSVNVSLHDILSPKFRRKMREALEVFHKPSNLTFELLEDECVANLDGIQDFIAEVRSYGVKIAIDDFGSGYSNLLEIAKIRPDYIKIDGQIISNIERFEENESILEAVALLGERLSIDLVAEFVETAAIQERVMAHSIFYSQGYHFSKPKVFSEVLLECAQQDKSAELVVQAGTSDILERVSEGTGDRDFLRAIQAITSDLLFIFNLATKQMRHFGPTVAEIGLPAVVENFPQSIIDEGVVPAEDIPVMLEGLHRMRCGIEEPSYFRILHKGESVNWYRMDYKVVVDQRNVPVEVIGKLTNIQQQKDMEARINIDAMTGCLRKDAFEALAQDYLQSDSTEKGVLFIVDLDNFKAVNDNLGHQFGDGVLRNVGDKLHTLFRPHDLIGRIGGDEFMVMMVGVDDLNVAKRKATEILAALDTTYKGTIQAYHLSASIGMAVYPRDGENFQTLYDHADMALFDAKNRGKNVFVIYNEILSKGTMENALPYQVAARALAQHYDTRIVEETFNLLFETKEFEISLQAVLQLIGTRFGVSRCYIFERHTTLAAMYTNTYEWCADGISEEISTLEAVPQTWFQELFDQANGDGILYCNDLSMLKKQEGRDCMAAQGIKSFLHTYIASEGDISYVIGVDDCNAPRRWTPIELSTIAQAGKIIAQFLSYKKVVLDLEIVAQERLSVLNSLNYFAYIIDRKTYEITYFNDFTKAAVPDIALGKKCYSVIRKKASPCADCPLRMMMEQGLTNIHSIIYDSVLGRKLLTMSSLQASFAGRECGCVTAIALDDIAEIDTKE